MTTQLKREKATPLSKADVALVKGMLLRKDRQSDIAAYFSVNGGRIAEINKGQRHPEVSAARADELPPAGPYVVSVRSAIKTKQTLEALRELINQTLEEVAKWERNNHD